jgi:hypothetical protein
MGGRIVLEHGIRLVRTGARSALILPVTNLQMIRLLSLIELEGITDG